ncbi:MAG: D-2-hydroxyacid dehydrogenase family protein [Burkholderiaceae bacterium]|nr:D-2-hydroxyacid dehydrogenase family protein [Burkholderiaceae bacterium]
MLKIAVINDFLRVFRQATDWSRLDGVAQVDFFHDILDTEDKAAERLAPYDIVVTERERTHFTGALLQRLPRLRLLVTTGTHNRYIDFATAAARGVTVTRTQAILHAAPELAWGLILVLMRRIVRDHESLRAGGWQTGLGRSLRGKMLGLVGLGVTGVQMVPLAQAFGMKTQAWSPHMDEARAQAAGTRYVAFDELLATSDVVSLHMVLADSTRGIIGRRELQLMQPHAYLVNTSRGALVDEEALIEALRDQRIAGAGLDVFTTEPMPASHPLRSVANVVMTPHTGYITDEQYALCFGQAVENILAFLAGAPVRVMTHT